MCVRIHEHVCVCARAAPLPGFDLMALQRGVVHVVNGASSTPASSLASPPLQTRRVVVRRVLDAVKLKSGAVAARVIPSSPPPPPAPPASAVLPPPRSRKSKSAAVAHTVFPTESHAKRRSVSMQ